MNNSPLVSVIMPAYNVEDFIEESIESILNQTYKNFELIILDDASSDGTWEIIKSYAEKDSRIIPIRNKENLYIAKNRNKGLTYAKGKYIVWQDSDDISLSYRLERQVMLMEKEPEVGICGGYLQSFMGDQLLDVRKYASDDASLRNKIFKFSPVAQPAAIIRKEALDLMGDYDITTPPAEDLDMSFRIGTHYKFANIPEILIKYREHSSSATHKRLRAQIKSTLRIRKKYNGQFGYKMNLMDDIAYIFSWFVQWLPSRVTINLFKIARFFIFKAASVVIPPKTLKQNYVVVTHKYVNHPDDELVKFLNINKKRNVLHITHSFNDKKDRSSSYSWYEKGILSKKYISPDYNFLRKIEPLLYLKEFLYTVYFVFTSKVKWDAYVGMDGLCVSFGLFLKLFYKRTKVIFWAIDYVPQDRFEAGFKNVIYKAINSLGYKRADEMWDLSPRMVEARKKFGNIAPSCYKTHKVVPYGVFLDHIKHYSYDNCQKHTLVFMGHLIEKQGVQQVIKAIPQILESIPEFKFKIIGGGLYMPKLVALAEELDVLDKCIFTGRVEDYSQLENEIAKSALAIAPYIKELDTWTYYADPGKIKTYLSCGVPVLLTDLPWNAQEIEKKGAGIIISSKVSDIALEVVHFMQTMDNQDYRNNAIDYAKSFDYSNIFKELNL